MEVVVGEEKLYSHNLRDFLRIKEEDHRRNLNQSTSSSSGAGRRSITMSAFLNDKIAQPPPPEDPPRRSESSRTLLDIIREDQTAGLRRGGDDGRSSWRHLKDKIRLRRRITDNNNNNNNNNNNHHNQSDESIQPDSRAPIPLTNPRRSTERSTAPLEPSISPRMRQLTADGNGNSNVNEERRIDAAELALEGNDSPLKMSLMALLAENDRQMGYESSAYAMDEDEPEEEVNDVVIEETGTSTAGGGSKGAEGENCCVCMVRHKGAAFIPCGHTFCRLCSRELWVQRGNCPLCNNFIVEILDIF
ncbi:RNA-binding protein MEX3B-like [Salvia splendens]|uniref:RNA-binding protein MEX3B-like n=1 Tax=Salvia splendens TaxID=180675 RepID=UPI0011039588|nr:RNA-binding protein MEX3B-like [Salvia splendens]XP_041990591.1 RNA-binding protein MEX3B-like [Salvia splendens]XP_041990592.1 RNA-binding protein MEX3B-like [Salvia splendens]